MKEQDYLFEGFSLFHIRNRNEIKVIKIMKEVMAAFPDFDRCRICIEDVYALSLSRLPPKYVQVGSIVIRKELTEDNIRNVVYASFKTVMDNPNHYND